jgi:hypothetical protein
VLDRVQRWATVTDPRIVRRLWPAQPDGAQHALCPSCGGTMPNGMLVTLNQLAPYFPAGPAHEAITAGDVGALTPDLPIEPGELWRSDCTPSSTRHSAATDPSRSPRPSRHDDGAALTLRSGRACGPI